MVSWVRVGDTGDSTWGLGYVANLGLINRTSIAVQSDGTYRVTVDYLPAEAGELDFYVGTPIWYDGHDGDLNYMSFQEDNIIDAYRYGQALDDAGNARDPVAVADFLPGACLVAFWYDIDFDATVPPNLTPEQVVPCIYVKGGRGPYFGPGVTTPGHWSDWQPGVTQTLFVSPVTGPLYARIGYASGDGYPTPDSRTAGSVITADRDVAQTGTVPTGGGLDQVNEASRSPLCEYGFGGSTVSNPEVLVYADQFSLGFRGANYPLAGLDELPTSLPGVSTELQFETSAMTFTGLGPLPMRFRVDYGAYWSRDDAGTGVSSSFYLGPETIPFTIWAKPLDATLTDAGQSPRPWLAYEDGTVLSHYDMPAPNAGQGADWATSPGYSHSLYSSDVDVDMSAIHALSDLSVVVQHRYADTSQPIPAGVADLPLTRLYAFYENYNVLDISTDLGINMFGDLPVHLTTPRYRYWIPGASTPGALQCCPGQKLKITGGGDWGPWQTPAPITRGADYGTFRVLIGHAEADSRQAGLDALRDRSFSSIENLPGLDVDLGQYGRPLLSTSNVAEWGFAVGGDTPQDYRVLAWLIQFDGTYALDPANTGLHYEDTDTIQYETHVLSFLHWEDPSGIDVNPINGFLGTPAPGMFSTYVMTLDPATHAGLLDGSTVELPAPGAGVSNALVSDADLLGGTAHLEIPSVLHPLVLFQPQLVTDVGNLLYQGYGFGVSGIGNLHGVYQPPRFRTRPPSGYECSSGQAPYLRMTQRNDGLGISPHPQLGLRSTSSNNPGVAPRIGRAARYD